MTANDNGCANPDVLVSTAWVDQNKGSAGIQLVEANEDILLYETSHILRTPIEK